MTHAYLLDDTGPRRDALRAAIGVQYLGDETQLLDRLVGIAELPEARAGAVVVTAAGWVERVRAMREQQSSLDAFMQQYDLSSEEGVLLMCLAEALLRIPDDDTAEKLIADKLADADWEAHLGRSDSLFVNASTWGLMLTGRLVKLSPVTTGNLRAALNRLIGHSTEPVIRLAIRQAMRLMGSQFVMGRTIAEALRVSTGHDQRAYLHSFDMLGEAALTAADAERHLAAYEQAIVAIGLHAATSVEMSVHARPGVSVKLSALHPRYGPPQGARVRAELAPRLRRLALLAREQRIGLTIDAEEAERLDLSLDLFERVYADPALDGWEGFGLAVQAFQKRALAVIDWLGALAEQVGRRIPVRLVKGAYWDTEIKRAQEQGLEGYPVFSRKLGTDVSYLACARRLLAARDRFYPMLATHNAHTIAAVCEYASETSLRESADADFEFQRLHGMGEALYEVVREDRAMPCRVYAPVGSHEDLLPYLVRRLLENGANTSFVNRIFDEQLPALKLVADPVAAMRELPVRPNPNLPRPADLYGSARRNSAGLNLADESVVRDWARRLAAAPSVPWQARSRLAEGTADSGVALPVHSPADRRRVVGDWIACPCSAVDAAMRAAQAGQSDWDARSVDQRAQLLERAADALESRRAEALRLLIDEAGKTMGDAVAEVREAADFLRYYAQQARRLMAVQPLPGPTGEHNELQLHGRGVFVCLSPWNFPLAIFVGQVAAALVTGNTVVAKPAEQTPLIADWCVRLLHDTGVPRVALQLLLGDGALGAALVADPRTGGVAFTGSVEVAQHINRSLAARSGPIVPLIAETGGQNAMIVDSSALPEQVVRDALLSAFGSAGQRCSALRVLYLQEEIADRTERLLRGAMRELRVGDPRLLATDVGPVIDEESRSRLQAYIDAQARAGRLIERLPMADDCAHGSFVAPTLLRVDSIADLDREHFGPVLHVARWRGAELERVVAGINASGYGLTLGVHSRIETTWRRVQALARVGNCYVNRGMTGAVVGTQPFGGEGMSGTGPKAGGPHYLLRFVVERTLTVNTAAVGGNARLLASSG